MQIDERLHPYLDRWVIEAEAGRLLSAAELGCEHPELLPELEREIAILRLFRNLAQPGASTSVEGRAAGETTSDEPDLDESLGPLLSPGSSFGRYEIIAVLDKGGMGVVYQARDSQLGRDVALKVMRPDVAAKSTSSDRFLREARALAALRHDHVVEIYDYGELDGVRFVTMPLLAGEHLKARLDRQGALPSAEVVRIGTELAEGLAAVHEKGLIHRDVKPSNVWLEAPNGRVKLLDFGLARDSGADDRVTRIGALVGTPAYMSPEQVNGLDVDARSDLFSLGSVLYEAATGQSAFAAKTRTAILKAVGETDAPPARIVNPDISQGLSDLIEWLHRKSPADRPASATEVVKALRGLATARETPTTDWQGARTQRAGEKKRSKRIPTGAAFAFAVFLIIAGIAAFVRDRFRDNRPDDGSPAPAIERTEPLRIRALDVHHYVSKTKVRGLLGTDSFGASPDDDIKVTARLSRPAYCYLVVFRPDGKEEFLPPKGTNDPPQLTDEPRYPTTSRGDVYGLSDGNGGLWLVALVASEKPLPPYSEWRKQHPGGPWQSVLGESKFVWFDDGDWLELETPGRARTRVEERGEKKVTVYEPIVDVVDWLKAETGGVVSAVAFKVEPRGQ